MRAEKRIDYVEFPSTDIAATKKFYSEVMGWEFQDYGPDYCAFNDGRTDGGFYSSDVTSAYSSGAPLIVFYAEDLEAFQERVTNAGGRICKEIFSFPGGRRFHFTDPGGNELAVWSDK